MFLFVSGRRSDSFGCRKPLSGMGCKSSQLPCCRSANRDSDEHEYSTPTCKPSFDPTNGWYRIKFPSNNRHAATGCPLSALTVVSRVALPFLTWCEMTTKSLLSRKMQLAFVSVILTLLVVGAISYRGMVLSSESDRSAVVHP